MQSHIRKMYACLAVTCHLRFWQNDRGLLCATTVTRGWNGYRNKSQHRKLTLEKKILPPLQQGFEPATFQSRVRRSIHWAIPAPDMGHQGYKRTMELLRPRVYWPAMYREAKDYISSCERCTMGHAPALHTTSSHLLAGRPLEILTIDFTKIETASDGRENSHRCFLEVHPGHTDAQPGGRDSGQGVGSRVVPAIRGTPENPQWPG